MSKAWPMVPLGEVLTLYKDYIDAPEAKIYPKLSVKLYGRGVVLDTPADGSSLKMQRHQLAKAGQVILSEIWGKKGAIGFVPPDGDAALCTSHFFLFDVNTERLAPKWLQAIFSANYLETQLNTDAKGSTGYAAVRPKHLLAASIPLPPLPEQQRITACVDSLVAKVEEARRIRTTTMSQVDRAVAAFERNIWPNQLMTSAPALQDVTTFLARGRQSKQGESKHFLIKTQHVQMRRYLPTNSTLDQDAANSVLSEAKVRQDDILIACSAAGCLGRVAYYDDDGRIASCDTHIAIARANQEIILPRYLYAYLAGYQGQFQLRSRERGDWQREKIGFRLTELNIADLRRIPVPLPSTDYQREVVANLDALQGRIDSLKNLQAQTANELDALLPSILNKAFRGEL